jgi:hypothetical protein
MKIDCWRDEEDSENYTVRPFTLIRNHYLTYNSYFRLSDMLQHVSASLGHHQVYTLLLKSFLCHIRMSLVNALLFLILKYLKVKKIMISGDGRLRPKH